MRIPYQTWTGRKINLNVLRPFGCLVYSLIPMERRQFKLNPTAEKGIMLGYENDFSSYRILKLNDKRIVRKHSLKTDWIQAWNKPKKKFLRTLLLKTENLKLSTKPRKKSTAKSQPITFYLLTEEETPLLYT
ncbi:uncharacterized protein VP01_448g1 [Puccinia sorghi]|uniref:Retroviral polymerase SH3-like domain-containing protein n=1 Tax=Puccinia sorghi TaxID=27349 RepID=A0A0L6UR72_9BASI|nr:uncharacterized protein VP01_448g1 [Puccinia sorghi]